MRKREDHAYEILALLPFRVESFGPYHHAKSGAATGKPYSGTTCVSIVGISVTTTEHEPNFVRL